MGDARFFALIPSGTSLTAEQVTALQDRLEPFTLVLLTGADTTATVVSASRAVVLEPELTNADIEEASSWIGRLRSFTGADAG